jgi:hypothetical protein
MCDNTVTVVCRAGYASILAVDSKNHLVASSMEMATCPNYGSISEDGQFLASSYCWAIVAQFWSGNATT